MRRALFVLISLLMVSCSTPSERQITPYIPADLDDAHRELVRMLPAKELKHIEAMTTEGEMIRYHMTLGLSLRNQWGLWHDSGLAKYLTS